MIHLCLSFDDLKRIRSQGLELGSSHLRLTYRAMQLSKPSLTIFIFLLLAHFERIWESKVINNVQRN